MQFVSSTAVAGLLALVSLGSYASGAPTTHQPNVLFILTDDQGKTMATVPADLDSDKP